jgi:glutamate mutase epsilon subunit
MEVITAIEGLGLDYHQGNVLKYIARYRHKNGMEDLLKAKWYVDRLIYIYEQEQTKLQRSMV